MSDYSPRVLMIPVRGLYWLAACWRETEDTYK